MKRHSNTIYRLLAAVTFVAALTVTTSCRRELDFTMPDLRPEERICFGSEGLDISVGTKASEVTSLSSFYVSAVTGSAGSEVSAWTSTQFNQVPASSPAVYSSDKYWPASNPEYKFYGSNVALNFAAGGTYVNASNATDVVCAYLSSPTYRTKNTLSFEHIFARLCRVDVVAQTGYTISNISMYITPKTGGTYNLRTKEWSSVATGSATTIASSTGANNNDIFCVPGIYSITASWVARDANGTSVTHTNEVCNVPLASGKTNNISCVLGGDLTFGVDLQDYCNYDYRDNLDYFTLYSPDAQTIRWNVGCINYVDLQDLADDYELSLEEIFAWLDSNMPEGDIRYSKDFGATWTSISPSIDGTEISVNAGDIIMFSGDNSCYSFEGIEEEPFRFFFSFEEPTYAYGDICSLLSGQMNESAFLNFFARNSKLLSFDSKPLVLSSATLANNCYKSMFSGCTSLTSAPALPATTLANDCYYSMFIGCTSLTSAPDLPATTLANNCYKSMFSGCTSLTSAPALPATTLANDCYYSMFSSCTSLTSAPDLPATTLANNCYRSMFSGCTSLTSAPALPATTLANYCYYSMFQGCTSLASTTALPATTLVTSCYRDMFRGCTSLNYIKALFTTTPSEIYTSNWVFGVAPTGAFVKSSAATWNVTGTYGVPSGWTVITE